VLDVATRHGVSWGLAAEIQHGKMEADVRKVKLSSVTRIAELLWQRGQRRRPAGWRQWNTGALWWPPSCGPSAEVVQRWPVAAVKDARAVGEVGVWVGATPEPDYGRAEGTKACAVAMHTANTPKARRNG